MEFEERIKKIELELTALKTAAGFSSTRSSSSTVASVSTGVYRVEFEESDEAIMAQYYLLTDVHGLTAKPRTASNGAQVVEVNTTYWGDDGYITTVCSLEIIANRPVVGVVKIS